MLIREIYQKYQIMPQLSLHMRRVGGVGKIIMSGWKETIDQDLVLRVLLLHDVGNIVKFDLSEEGQKKLKSTTSVDLPYWRQVQQEFWAKYGQDAHEVTKQIVAELKQDDVNSVMEQDHMTYHSDDRRQILDQPWPAQLLQYADTRVIPSGVVTLKERIADLCRRYNQPIASFAYMYDLERGIAARTTINLETIGELDVKPLFDELLTYDI